MSLANLMKKVNQQKQKALTEKGSAKDKKSSTAEICLFDYDVRSVNIERFNTSRRLLMIEAGEKFGEHSEIIRTGEHFKFAEPTPPADFNDKVVEIQYKTKYANYNRQQSDYDQKCIQFYHLVLSYCSPSMKNALKLRDDWSEVESKKDVLKLWLAIVDITMNGIGRTENEQVKIQNARHVFERIHQRPDESISDFFERFCDSYEVMTSQGCRFYHAFVPDETPAEQEEKFGKEMEEKEQEQKAITFLQKLDRTRFRPLFDYLDNEKTITHQDVYPKTLMDAYQLASRFRVNGVLCDTLMNVKDVHQGAAFTSFPKPERKGKERNRKEKKNLRSPAAATTPAPRGEDSRANGCYTCGDPAHKFLDCPLTNKVFSNLSKASPNLKLRVKGKLGLTSVKDLIEQYLLLGKEDFPFTENDILLDSESSVSIFNNASLLKNIRKAEQPVRVSGVGKGHIDADLVGDFLDFGEGYYNPNAIANILCFYDVDRRYGVEFRRGKFYVTIPSYGTVLEFKSRRKHYICNFQKYLHSSRVSLTTTDLPEIQSRRPQLSTSNTKIAGQANFNPLVDGQAGDHTLRDSNSLESSPSPLIGHHNHGYSVSNPEENRRQSGHLPAFPPQTGNFGSSLDTDGGVAGSCTANTMLTHPNRLADSSRFQPSSHSCGGRDGTRCSKPEKLTTFGHPVHPRGGAGGDPYCNNFETRPQDAAGIQPDLPSAAGSRERWAQSEHTSVVSRRVTGAPRTGPQHGPETVTSASSCLAKLQTPQEDERTQQSHWIPTGGEEIKVQSQRITTQRGEFSANSDIEVREFPSDHRPSCVRFAEILSVVGSNSSGGEKAAERQWKHLDKGPPSGGDSGEVTQLEGQNQNAAELGDSERLKSSRMSRCNSATSRSGETTRHRAIGTRKPPEFGLLTSRLRGGSLANETADPEENRLGSIADGNRWTETDCSGLQPPLPDFGYSSRPDLPRNEGVSHISTNVTPEPGTQEPRITNVCDQRTLLVNPSQQEANLVATVEDNMLKYTKREVARAELAMKLFRACGRPSLKDFVQLLRSNQIKNCPVKVEDFTNGLRIWGLDEGILRGRTVTQKPLPVDEVVPVRVKEDFTILYIDLAHIQGVPFMVSVSKGYNLLVVNHLRNRTRGVIEESLTNIVNCYKKHNVIITTILCDGESAVTALKTFLEGRMIDLQTCSRNEHIARVERNIRLIKERVRSFLTVLPYKLTKTMLVYLVQFVVMMINNVPRATSAIEGVSPREKLTGKSLDFDGTKFLEFGEYCHVNEEDNVKNSMKSRTFPAICLGPVGNMMKNYYFLNLETFQVVKRRQWIALPLPSTYIEKINARAVRDEIVIQAGQNEEDEDAAEILDAAGTTADLHNNLPNYGADREREEDPREPEADTNEADVVNDRGQIDNNAQWDYEPRYFTAEDGLEEENSSLQENGSNESGSGPRYNLRPTPQRAKYLDRFGLLSTYSIQKALKLNGKEATESMAKEMTQIHSKGVLCPMNYNELTPKQKARVIRSMMNIRRKRNGTLKSRFLADGSQQLRHLSQVNPSSPTVSTEALFICAAIDALEKRHRVTVDVEGAYLHADMTEEVLLKIEPTIASILVGIDKNYEKFRLPDQSLICKLNKALYGCIQSAALWYENIAKALSDFGFEKNPYQRCIFNKTMYGKQVTVRLYVDDLKISSEDRRGVDDVLSYLKRVYKNINVYDDDNIDYLGMDFDYSTEGVVKVSMKKIIEKVLEEIQVDGTCRTPASNELFLVDETSELLPKDLKEKFHSVVALLLYLAKRARPDILTAISFLTTRVMNPTQQDWNKLLRIVKYLKGTIDLTLHLSASKDLTINSFIDASFATHPDMKSHTGEMITLGGGAILCKSSKQKLVSRSSTEAELIALNDGLSDALWVKSFLEGQGYKTNIVINQDNKSTIALAEKGESTTTRTRHINIRYFFIKEKIDNKEVKLVHMKTEDMLADFFSKPLQGSLFERMRDAILNIPK